MNDTFDEKLARVTGTIRHVVMDDPHRRYGGGLLYWANKAERLHNSAMVLGGDPGGQHFEAFTLLAGSSLEVLIKGILTGLGEQFKPTHNLVTLINAAGIEVSDDDRAVLKAFTIYTTWHARYPVARNAHETIEGREFLREQYPDSGRLSDIFEWASRSPKAVNAANYERLYGLFRDRFFQVNGSVYESATYSWLPEGG